MSDTRLTIRLSPSIRKALRQKAKAIGKPESEVARAAIEKDVTRPRTAYDVFKEVGLIGCAPGGPPDLSTNKKYMEGFGEWRNDPHRRRPARSAGKSSRSVS